MPGDPNVVVSIETLFEEDAGMLRRPRYQLLLLANVNAALGTVLFSPLLETLTGPFGISEVQAGLMITMFTAPSIVGIPFVGVLADKYGRKLILVVALLLFGLAGTGIAFVTDLRIALSLRMLQGIGYAGITPSSSRASVTSTTKPRKRRPKGCVSPPLALSRRRFLSLRTFS